MRALLVFLCCFVPATALLAYLGRDDAGAPHLPADTPQDEGAPLLAGDDFADPYGRTPFSGSLRRLEGFELRVVEEGYFKLFLRIGQLAREGDRPRLEAVRGAVFDPPVDGTPNLRLTLRAPYVSGDPRELVQAAEGLPRRVTLDGGVEVHDAAGRLLAELPRLEVDLDAKTLSSDLPVVLRLPDREVEVRAPGLFADLGLRRARLPGPVALRVEGATGPATLRAEGGATVEEDAEAGRLAIRLEGGAGIQHALGRARCDGIDVELAREEKAYVFRRAALRGNVVLDIAPGTAGGLETIEMPALVISGDESITCEGPLRATWRGRLPAVALGERTVAIEAAGATIRLARTGEGGAAIEEARFDALRAGDTEAAGSLSARTLSYTRAGNVLVAEGAVEAATPDAALAAERLRIESPEKDAYDVVIEGEKRVSYVADGRLGPLGEGARGTLHVTCTGPLRLRARGDRAEMAAAGGVVATVDAGARLEGDEVSLAVDKGQLTSFRAQGGVLLAEERRKIEIRSDALSYEGGLASIAGAPASVALGDGRLVRAPEITYREGGAFAAAGGVVAELPLAAAGGEGEAWHIRCAEASGLLGEKGQPARLEARGGLRADGPDGASVEGDLFVFDGETGEANLAGAPARLRRGDEVELVAPKGLVLRVEEGRVVEGRSLATATIDYRPPQAKPREPAEPRAPAFTLWHVELRGPARFEGERIVVPAGATLLGHDGDEPAIYAEAGHVELRLGRRDGAVVVRELLGSQGVRVEGRGKDPAVVTARSLSYRAGEREVRIAGEAAVEAAGWPREVRFRELLFSLTKDGIDLKRASEIEVR